MEENNVEEKETQKGSKFSSLDFVGFMRYLQMRISIVILAGLAGFALSALYCFVIAKPVYESTAQLYVINSQDSAINLSDLQIGSYLASDYQLVFNTWEVNQQVINNLNLPYTVTQIKKKLSVTNPSNTRILMITFKSEDAKESAQVANEYAAVASQYISDYMLTSKPTVISTALEPLKPTYPRKKLIVAVSTMVAMLIAAWGLFAAFVCDDKIKTADDIRRYMNTEPLAVIPMTRIVYRRGKGRKEA